MPYDPISRARYVQENRKSRFQEAFDGWAQAEAALLRGQCERRFRRHFERYQAVSLEGPLDKRLSQIFKRLTSRVDVDKVVQLY